MRGLRFLCIALGLIVAAALALHFMVPPAHATWKPQYGKEPAAVRDWYQAAEVPGGIGSPAYKRLGFAKCCETSERFKTQFVGARDHDWSYYLDPKCTHDGCAIAPISADVVHGDPIKPLPHALDSLDAVERDKVLKKFQQMRSEGILFIHNGKPSCFWPPRPGG